MLKKIWYASYGSNLSYQNRFMCYIVGGRPVGSQRTNSGCRDKTPPLDNRPIPMNFELYFAEYSQWWRGGVAFIKHGNDKSKTLGRMYLITDDQFNDVVLQENSRDVDGTRLLPPFEQLSCQDELLLPGIRMYGRLFRLGQEGKHPIFTFTNAKDELPPRAPSEAYVKIIASGIKETYSAMTNSEICEYLLGADGIRNLIQPQQISRWVEEAD